MPGLYSQQICAATEIISAFVEKKLSRFVLLYALMQSGKTDTFLFVACELLRLGHVERIVIFSGNREVELTKQLKQDAKDFVKIYSSYLQTHHSKSKTDSEMAAEFYLNQDNRFFILGGQDLKKFAFAPIPTLYIWEESHYGQSKNQEVDKFLDRIGLSSTGENLGSNFVISVSATPFSEVANLYNRNQPKHIVRLIPDEKYLSPEKLKATGRLISITNPEQILREILPTFAGQCGYVLIRATEEKQAQFAAIAGDDWIIEKYDQTSKKKGKTDLNKDILDIVPKRPTIVFLKGMCRMGKRINKRYILFGLETSDPNTDTLLQGLLGRWCGYHIDYDFTAPIFVFDLDMQEIDSSISQWNLQTKHGPERFMNGEKSKTTSRTPIIPIRVALGDEDRSKSDYEPAKVILDALEKGKMENHNDRRFDDIIHQAIRSICGARATKVKTEEQKQLSKHCKVLTTANRDFPEKIGLIQNAFHTRKPTYFGSGWGSMSKEEEIVVIKGDTEIYFYMFIENDAPADHVCKTTGNEIFCGKTPAPVQAEDIQAFLAVGAAMAAAE